MVYIDETKRAGWDNLYEDCFEDINKIVEDNLNLKHDKEIIEKVFLKMLKALENAIKKMENEENIYEEKAPWFDKANNIYEYSKTADTLNKKVITINMIDQFLRATY
jgi:ATP-dependent RNA circularization protein (DNA/RNA ligase family)